MMTRVPAAEIDRYDYSPFNSSGQAQMYDNLYAPGNCVDQIRDCNARGIDEICGAADSFCANEVEGLYDVLSGRDEYDIRELTPDPFPPEFYVGYLNMPSVLAAVGAYVNYTEYSNAVGTAFGATGDDGRLDSTIQDMTDLINYGLTVMMYHG
jgi:hypothetical protein